MAKFSITLKSINDLSTYDPNCDPQSLLSRLSGEFADAMCQIFPGDWGWAALLAPIPTRQIWFAILSGMSDYPSDTVALRRNLLALDHGLMLRLRFAGLAEPIRGIVTRLMPLPLPKAHYAELARMLESDPSLIAWYAGQSDLIDTMELAEILATRIKG